MLVFARRGELVNVDHTQVRDTSTDSADLADSLNIDVNSISGHCSLTTRVSRNCGHAGITGLNFCILAYFFSFFFLKHQLFQRNSAWYLLSLCGNKVTFLIAFSLPLFSHLFLHVAAIITSKNYTLMGETHFSSTNVSLPLVCCEMNTWKLNGFTFSLVNVYPFAELHCWGRLQQAVWFSSQGHPREVCNPECDWQWASQCR